MGGMSSHGFPVEEDSGTRDNALQVEQSGSVGSTSCAHLYVSRILASSCTLTFDAKSFESQRDSGLELVPLRD